MIGLFTYLLTVIAFGTTRLLGALVATLVASICFALATVFAKGPRDINLVKFSKASKP
jgi:hypothetical protein